jgi:hypothetical protein
MSDVKGDKQPEIQQLLSELNSAVNMAIENTNFYYGLVNKLDNLSLDSDMKACAPSSEPASGYVEPNTVISKLRAQVNLLNSTNRRDYEIIQRFREMV